MTKKKKSDLRQLDIIAALKGKDVFVETEVEEVDNSESKAISLFDCINAIRKNKDGSLLDKEQNVSSFDSYMVIKGLGMKLDDVMTLNFINKYSSTLDKKQMFQLLYVLIEQDSKFYQWIKSEKEDKSEYIDVVAKHFECSEKEAFEYISILGETFASTIQQKYGNNK